MDKQMSTDALTDITDIMHGSITRIPGLKINKTYWNTLFFFGKFY